MSVFSDKFIQVINEALEKDSKVAIFTHATPDPDALGSALGIQWLLKNHFEVDSAIFHEGAVSHPQNKTMRNVLDITLNSFNEYKKGKYDYKILVDSTSANVPIQEPTIVIDHHKIEEPYDGALSNVDPVGACSTLVFELIVEIVGENAFEPNTTVLSEATSEDTSSFLNDNSNVASALYFGILNDTECWVSDNCTNRDSEASQFLNQYIDKEKVKNITKYPIPRYFLELEKVLGQEDNHEEKNSCFVGTVGIITSGKRDAIPMLADERVQLEGVETAIIFGIVDDKLEASIRSQSSSTEVNATVKNIFGKNFSGGKKGSGAAKVPLGIFDCQDCPEELQKKVWEAMRDKIFYSIFHVMAGN